MQRFPVFVVGSPRSGTSILVDALLAGGYNGFREGGFVSVIGRMNFVVDQQYRDFAGDPEVLISQIDAMAFKRSLWNLVKRAVDKANPVPPWFDKTGNPEMLTIAPIIQELWPDAVFIFCKRRAIENVQSRLKKFPAFNFEYHCRDWSRNMATWRHIRDQLPRDTYIEVDQQEMIQSPSDVAGKLRDFLHLTPEGTALLGGEFTSSRPQQTEAGSAARVLSLETVDWPESSKLSFEKDCGVELEAYGYSLDESYWLART